MELEPLQNEEVYEARELTPVEQLQQQWKQQPGFISFVRQKNVIDQNAELLPYAGAVWLPGGASPRALAIQGLVLVAVVLSLFNWYQTRHRGKLEDEIVALRASVQAERARQQGIIDAAQLETKRVLRSTKPAVWRGLAGSRGGALEQLRNSEEDARRPIHQFEEQHADREPDLPAH